MTQIANAKTTLPRKKKPEWISTLKRVFKTPGAKIGGVLFLLIVLASVFAPILATHPPYAADFRNAYAPPSAQHIFGTDHQGRDVYSRVLFGGRYSLALGLCAALLGNMSGVVLGSIAGYFGGRTEQFIMRFCDIWSAIPGILLTIIIASSLGAGFLNTIIAMSIGGIPMGARMTRGQILAERSKEYLEAAESINCSKFSIMFKHLLPNVISPTIIMTTTQIGFTITGAAGLSYLGLGVKPPTPEWGAMLSEAVPYIRTNPTLLLFPGIALGLCVLSINLVGDGLRDAIDPKLRK